MIRYFNIILTFVFIIMLTSAGVAQQTGSFDDYPAYAGNDLGVNYSPKQTVFKVWAPMLPGMGEKLSAPKTWLKVLMAPGCW
jgi:hypothetical protein